MACTKLLSTEFQTDLPAEFTNIPFDTAGAGDFYFAFPSAGADRTVTYPNASITLAGIDLAQTWTAKQTFDDVDVGGLLQVLEAGSVGFQDEVIWLNYGAGADPTGFAGIEVEMLSTNLQLGFNTSDQVQAGLIGSLYDIFGANLFTADSEFLVGAGNGTYAVEDAPTARTSLGLDTAAVEPVATFFQVANNLSEGTAATMLGNLGLDTSLQNLILSGPTVDRTVTLPDANFTISSWIAANLLNDADQAAARTTLGVTPGTDVQVYDAFLTSIAALGTTGDRILTITGVDTAAEQATSAFGLGYVALADAAAGRTKDGFTNAILDYTAPPTIGGTTPGIVNASDLNTTGMLNMSAPSALTIATDAITVTESYSTLAGQGAAADDLVTINGGSQGVIIF